MHKISVCGIVFLWVLAVHAGPGFASYDVSGGDASIILADDTSDGIRFLDAVNRTATVTVDKLIGLITATPAMSVSTATDNMGTLLLQGNTTLSGDVGASGATLAAVSVGVDGTASLFSGEVHAATMNITGTGTAALGGDLNGALSYDGDGVVTLADTMAITGAVTNDTATDGQGTLTLFGSGTVSGQVGASGAALKIINTGVAGSVSTFAGDIYAQTMNITGTGSAALGGDFNGALSYDDDGTVTVADTMAVTGAVTNDTATDGRGTLTFLGSSTVSGLVGLSGAALKVINAGANGSTTTFANEVHTQTMNITGTGGVGFYDDLNGALSYDADGTAAFADGQTVTGAVTNDTGSDARGTLTLVGSSTVAGQVGAAGAALKVVDAGANGSTSTFASDVFTQTMNVTGTGTAALDGDLNGALSYDGDGVVALADTKAVTGAVTNDTATDGQGTLTLLGSGTVAGQVGASGAALKVLNAGANGSTSAFSADVYVQTMNITGTGAVALNGDLDGDLSYDADGTVTLAGGQSISGPVTNDTGANGQGTLTLSGSATMAVQLGASGAALKEVNAGANGSAVVFSNDVFAQELIVTGTGTVALNADLNGALAYDGDGTVTLADGQTITGAVSNDSGTDHVGALNYVGTHATAGAVGTAGGSALRSIGISQGTFTMAHDMASSMITVDQDATFVVSGSRTITDGGLTVGSTGSSSVDLGANTLTLTSGAVNMASGTTVNLTASSASVYGRIVQAAADAVVSAGTTINVNVAGTIASGSDLTIVDGNAGTGVAAGISVLDNSIIMDFIAKAVAGADLVLTATADYDPAGYGGSTRAAADALAVIEGQAVSADLQTVLTQLHALPTAGAVSKAVMQMRPYEGTALVDQTYAMAADARRAVISHLSVVRNNPDQVTAVSRRSVVDRMMDNYAHAAGEDVPDDLVTYRDMMLRDAPDDLPAVNVWVRGGRSDAAMGVRNDVEGYSAEARGIVFGVDMIKLDAMVLGIGGNVSSADVDPHQYGIGATDIDRYSMILYSELNGVAPWHIDTVLSGSRNHYRTERTLRFGSIDRIAKGVFDGMHYDLYLEAGYDLLISSYKITPSLMLDYSYMSLDGYTESDADALNLIVKPSSYSHLRPGVGLSASSLLDLSGVRIMPQVYGKYYRECLAPVIKTSSAFSGTSTYFDTKGAKVARDTFETGISLDLLLPKEMSLKFNYDAELRQSYTSNVLSAQFKGKF